MANVTTTNPGAPSSSAGRSSSSNQNTTPSGNTGGNGGSSFDIVNGYDWSLNKPKDPPYIELKEYKVSTSQVTQGFAHFIKSTLENLGGTVCDFVDECIAGELATGGNSESSPHLEPYGGMYNLLESGNTFKLPYFENSVRSRTNSWATTFGGDSNNLIADFAAAGAKFVNQHMAGSNYGFSGLLEPGVFVERTRFYQPSALSEEPISLTFPLLNTQESGSIQKNKEFINTLARNTSPSRKSKTQLDPPHFYEALIPGIRFIKYGFISSFKVEMAGTRRMIGGDIIPEAYQITIEVKSLTEESGNFLIEAQK